jgi:hypothetical protein
MVAFSEFLKQSEKKSVIEKKIAMFNKFEVEPLCK